MAPTADSSAAEWLMQPGAPDLPTFESLLGRPTWTARAACRGEPSATFFGGRGVDYGPARRLCASCPVRSDCIEYALADPELDGLWAGTTMGERTVLRTARARREAS